MAMIPGKPFGILMFLAISISGCNSRADTKDPEIMYDMASKLKDISLGVQGHTKYSDTSEFNESDLLLKAVNNDLSKLEIFGEYKLRVRVDGKRSSVLLCDDDTALIEDTGCTPEVDLHHWNSDASIQCDFIINLDKACY